METETAPALSPKSVTLSGLPPNAAMLSRTHCRAIIWSKRPALPGTSDVPKYRKPRLATRYCIDTKITFSSDTRVLWSYTSRVAEPE